LIFLEQNREILIRDTNVLEVLSGFLLIKDLELMIEVNGAIRNFTLDGTLSFRLILFYFIWFDFILFYFILFDLI
jgi:hypothetical protein